MPGSLDDLSFTVWPPAIDISTPANQQIFNPQFGVANTSATEIVSLKRALLLVPVTTNGTNLAQNTDMVPNAITPGWTLSGAAAPPSDQGYAAFALLPDDGEGAIPPGGSVAFTLTGVNVNTAAGNAVLQLEARTSAGLWRPTYPIQLTTPSTTPAITRCSITPADPQTLTTLQGQSVVLSWTTSGAAYCTIEDDQGDKWENLPTSGTLPDTPAQGNAQIQSTPELGRYYNRTFTLTAYAAGAMDSDQRPAPTAIQLPTIVSFSVTPASLALGQQATVTWSVVNIDPGLGTITLTIDPADGTGTYTAAIAPTQASGSSVVTPTPQTTTTYTLAVDNGYGVAAPQLTPQQVTGPLPAGWQEMTGPETLSANWIQYVPAPFGIVAFAGSLWCWGTSSTSALYRTSDGTSWTAVTTTPPLPLLDGLIVADLGGGEKMWAFGCVPLWGPSGPPFLASSSDGIHWETQPTPAYAGRCFGNYVAGNGTILVLGAVGGAGYPATIPIPDVWSTSDGSTWTQVGNAFPGFVQGMFGCGAARFAGKLQTVGADSNYALWGYSSSDGGKTWSRTTTAIATGFAEISVSLLPAGDVLVMYGYALWGTVSALVMDSTGACSVSQALSYPNGNACNWSAATYNGCLWLAGVIPVPNNSLQFFRLNEVLPGTTFTLTPSANSASQ